MQRWIKPMWTLMLVTWAVAAALWYSLYKAKDIRAGNGKPIHVEWVDATRADTTAMVLPGANASYMVLYNATRDSTRIVPAAQVLRVTVARRKK